MTGDQTPDEKRFVCSNCGEPLGEEHVTVGDGMEVEECPECDTTTLRSSFIGRVAQVVEGEKFVDEVFPGLREHAGEGFPDKVVYTDEEGNEQTVDLDLPDHSDRTDEWTTGGDETCDIPSCPETENLEAMEGYGAIEQACPDHADDLRGLSRYEVTEDGLRLREDAERTEEEKRLIEEFSGDWDDREVDSAHPHEG